MKLSHDYSGGILFLALFVINQMIENSIIVNF